MPSDLICDHSLTRTNTKKRDKTTLEMILENLSSRQNFEHSAVLRIVRAACLHACADARLYAHIILWACAADATTHDAWVVGNCGGRKRCTGKGMCGLECNRRMHGPRMHTRRSSRCWAIWVQGYACSWPQLTRHRTHSAPTTSHLAHLGFNGFRGEVAATPDALEQNLAGQAAQGVTVL